MTLPPRGKEDNSSPNPFFIVGMQRSGTTMLRLMLNHHRNLAVPFESGFIPVVYKQLHKYGDFALRENAAACLQDISQLPLVQRGKLIENPDSILQYSIRSYADLVDAIFREYAKGKGKHRWGEKTPGQAMDLDVFWEIFPGCKIIHLLRDGRDVAVSLLGVSWGSRNLMKIADQWRWNSVVAHKLGKVLRQKFLEVRYEDLVRDPATELRAICEFLEEPYDENMLHYHTTATAEMPKVSLEWHKSSVSKPDPGKVGVWKREMSRADRIIFEQVAGDALELFGYERENMPSSYASKVKKIYYNVWKRY